MNFSVYFFNPLSFWWRRYVQFVALIHKATLQYKMFCGHMFSFLQDQYLGVEFIARLLSPYRFNFLTHYQSFLKWLSVSSVAESCPILWDSMDCSTPGLSVHHQLQTLLKLMSIESVMPSTISSSVIPFSCHLQSFLASGSFQMSQFFASGGQSIGVLASASILPMNIQEWFPLGLTGWVSLQSKGLSRVFSNTTVQKHQFFGTQLSL